MTKKFPDFLKLSNTTKICKQPKTGAEILCHLQKKQSIKIQKFDRLMMKKISHCSH